MPTETWAPAPVHRHKKKKQPKYDFSFNWKKNDPLIPKKHHKTAPKKKGVPIDAQGRIDLSQLAAQRLNFMDQYNQQLADINRNYAVQQQRMQQNEPYVQRGILSDYAGRGMAHSSGFGVAQGRETQLYNQNLSDLNYAHTYGTQDLQTQRQDYMRTLHMQQQAIRQAAAQRMATQAGTLGLYTGKKKVTRHRAQRILGIN